MSISLRISLTGNTFLVFGHVQVVSEGFGLDIRVDNLLGVGVLVLASVVVLTKNVWGHVWAVSSIRGLNISLGDLNS